MLRPYLRRFATTKTDQPGMPSQPVKLDLRSYLAPLGPVLVFGPNNFEMSGVNPVIILPGALAKRHSKNS